MKIKRLNKTKSREVTLFIHKLLDDDFADLYKKETIVSYKKNYCHKWFVNALSKRKNIVLGMYEEGALIGVIIVVRENGGVGHVEWLGVSKRYRQMGVASQLIKRLEETALIHKFHYLYLFTERESNIVFYKNRGYSYVGLHPNSWYGENEHMMSKHIADRPFKEAFII